MRTNEHFVKPREHPVKTIGVYTCMTEVLDPDIEQSVEDHSDIYPGPSY